MIIDNPIENKGRVDYYDKSVFGALDVYNIMREILLREDRIDQDKEHFWVMGLANNCSILYIELVSLGSATKTIAEPMNVFRVAILKGAVKVILIHNHPSGDFLPSKNDIDLTNRLIQAGKIIKISVLDHVVITMKGSYSFVVSKIMDSLYSRQEWEPQYDLTKYVRKEEKAIKNKAVMKAKKESLKKRNFELAKKMKDKGFHIDEIIELSGLNKRQIEKLGLLPQA
jgi:DNA repair protein RadC